jgi:hypothetical protein
VASFVQGVKSYGPPASVSSTVVWISQVWFMGQPTVPRHTSQHARQRRKSRMPWKTGRCFLH